MGGGVRRGRRHLDGRETIGQKHRRPGLWPQVTPGFPSFWLRRPGSFEGGFLPAVVERGLWSLGEGLLLLWGGGGGWEMPRIFVGAVFPWVTCETLPSGCWKGRSSPVLRGSIFPGRGGGRRSLGYSRGSGSA